MLVNRPQDRTKVMILVPSVIAVLLYFIFGVLPMMAKMRQDASPAATPVEPTTSNIPITPPETAAAAVPPSSPLAVDMEAPPYIVNDPFKPAIAPPATPAEAALVKPVGPTAGPAVVTNLTAAPIPGKSPGGIVIGPSVPGAPQAPAMPEITLQGVVLADRAVGVFRAGDQTFYKHIGDVVVSDMVLKLVADSGVVLARGKHLFTLEIGHSDLSPTNTLAAPANSILAKSSAQLDRAAMAYRAAEPVIQTNEVHTEALKTANAVPGSTVESVPDKTPARAVAVTIPVSKRDARVTPDPDKIEVVPATQVSKSDKITSVSTDSLSPEFRQVSLLDHKKAKVRHRRKHGRYGRIGRRHLARGSRRNHSRSRMA